jgi:hypothetical protein
MRAPSGNSEPELDRFAAPAIPERGEAMRW